MHVRAAEPSDSSAIARIHVLTWRAAYRGHIPDGVLDTLDINQRTTFWRKRLAKPPGWVFVAELNRTAVGFCDLIPARDQDADPTRVAEIAAIYVLAEHWRKGLGRALCCRALAEAKAHNHTSVTLWVLASHSPARVFYECLGFTVDGATKIDKISGADLPQVRYHIPL